MRIRFTIRDLLLITVIVALAVGWWLDHRKLTTHHERFEITETSPGIRRTVQDNWTGEQWEMLHGTWRKIRSQTHFPEPPDEK